jgi:hypothetical protein
MYYVELTSRSIPPYKTHLGKYNARRYLDSIKVGARCEGVYGGSARCQGVKSRTQSGEHATRHRHVSAQALFLVLVNCKLVFPTFPAVPSISDIS